MKRTVVALLGAAILVSGCSKIITIAVQAERERLVHLRDWESRVALMQCPELDKEYADLVKKKDDLVDFDQRQDIMRDEMTGKSCPLPEDLA